MTSEKFVEEIMLRLPFAHYMTKDEHNLYERDLLSYSQFKAPSKLDDIVDEFKKTEFKRRPGIWFFYKLDGGRTDSNLWWVRCDTCQTEYTQNSRTCPNCGDNVTTVMIEKEGKGLAENVVCVQRDCSECKIYHGGLENVKGPECGAWGKFPDDAQCEDCVCRMCCEYERDFIKNPRKVVRSGEAMPWMDYVKPVDIRRLIRPKEV
ncbi:MAG: hypothetical protein DRQ41_12630 [Gammaproteobacteria bacterium]|nr:MAG: hypothetical protein DRQ41_12630 [Gammaproteobacteria bacterium]